MRFFLVAEASDDVIIYLEQDSTPVSRKLNSSNNAIASELLPYSLLLEFPEDGITARSEQLLTLQSPGCKSGIS